MSLKYYLGVVISLPLLPFLYYQGKKIRKNVPKLPEAKEPKGYIKTTSERTLKILAIGESTIAGVGVDFHKNGFIGALATTISKEKNISVLWRVYAKSGFTAKMVRKRLLPKIEETNADIIVIGLGGNDAFKLNSPEVWIYQINLLIKNLKHKYPKTPIYFTNMPPIKEFPAFTKAIKFVIGNLVEILGKRLYKRVRKKTNVHYNNEIVTLEAWKERFQLDGNIDTFFSDGVHPSKLTYQVWGKDMAQFIMKSNSF
ncbi:SGNH/GDSL hydrolase family protein [Polaribacter porphyrae]|uniref:GDSL family lipase n=1 Tax=Polaribacter porphyrae TaxID=1137780 RepID=A0A2S7WP58_9FLAO|nr:SGNH/GDSL hydrolase family protein [Polaribacter porphyrae]PQJ79061.1 GDSL family lipase [Polaribacter porphyrae]